MAQTPLHEEFQKIRNLFAELTTREESLLRYGFNLGYSVAKIQNQEKTDKLKKTVDELFGF